MKAYDIGKKLVEKRAMQKTAAGAAIAKKGIRGLISKLFSPTVKTVTKTTSPAKTLAKLVGGTAAAGTGLHAGLKGLGAAGIGLPDKGGLGEVAGRQWYGPDEYYRQTAIDKLIGSGAVDAGQRGRVASPEFWKKTGGGEGSKGWKFGPSGFVNVGGKDVPLPSDINRFRYEPPSFIDSPLQYMLPASIIGQKGKVREAMGPEQATKFENWRKGKLESMQPKPLGLQPPKFMSVDEIWSAFPNATNPLHVKGRADALRELKGYERAMFKHNKSRQAAIDALDNIRGGRGSRAKRDSQQSYGGYRNPYSFYR